MNIYIYIYITSCCFCGDDDDDDNDNSGKAYTGEDKVSRRIMVESEREYIGWRSHCRMRLREKES